MDFKLLDLDEFEGQDNDSITKKMHFSKKIQKSTLRQHLGNK